MKASIDIGTNTALLLVAEVKDKTLTVIREEQRVPRLGTGVDHSGQLSDAAIHRVVQAIQEYQEIIESDYPSVDSIQVTATSAVRDAENRDHFLKVLKQETGLKVRVLSGLDEAKYTFVGAKSVLDHQKTNSNVIIDIGGGSTEIAYGSLQVQDRYSYDMGCVRFTERFLSNDPPTEDQLADCRDEIRRILKDYEFNFVDDASLIGVAGTVTSLAFIDKELSSYNNETISGHQLTVQDINDYISLFKSWPAQKLVIEYPVVMKGRADIFLAGLLILEEFMRKYNFTKFITSTGGIRHGVVLNLE